MPRRKRPVRALDKKEGKRFKIAYAEALNAFELLAFQFISTVRKAMADAGLKDHRMAHAALASQTADPLNAVWYSTFHGLVENDPALLKHLATIRNFNRELIKERNILAHTAFWGHPNADIAKEGLQVFLLRNSSEGAKSLNRRFRTQDLLTFRAKCDRAAHAVLIFSVAAKDSGWKTALDQVVARMKQS